MSTRATISIINKDGSVNSIYNHWDGYPSGLGLTLEEFYNEESLVRELISLGDASTIQPKLHPENPETHDFYTPEEGVSVFYGRDRGEDDVGTKKFSSLLDALYDFGERFNYVFQDGKWYCCINFDSDGVELLTIEEAIDYAEAD